MAESKDPAAGLTPAPVELTPAQVQEAIAQSAAQAAKDKLDETVEGGAYLVDDRWVNANGDPIPKPKGA